MAESDNPSVIRFSYGIARGKIYGRRAVNVRRSMVSLVKNSIHVTNATAVIWPQFGDKETTVNVTNHRTQYNGAYSINNGVICFVVDHEVYVTPYTRGAMETIEEAGLTQKYFYVPFSNWDYPKYERMKWEHLNEEAEESRHLDYEADCLEWSDDYGLGKLSDEAMSHCFKIPRKGVPVKTFLYETVVYPACDETCLDSTVIDKLGSYAKNNGIVVFVYRDGHTYIARGYWIIDELIQTGFAEADLYVPFSNGEKIIDLYLATLWDTI